MPSTVYRKYRSPLAGILAVVLVITPLLTHLAPTAKAFLPDQHVANLLGAPDSITHFAITQMGVQAAVKDLFPNVSLVTTQNAEFDIARANASVDDQGKPEYLQSSAHFDGESFSSSQHRLTSFKENVIAALNENRVSDARTYLGRALHTLQDFYAHSNWVEKGNSNTYDSLGDRNVSGSSLSPVTDQTPTCTEEPKNNCSAPDPLLPAAPLTTGYYTGETERPKGNKTWKCSHGGKVQAGLFGTFGDKEAPGSEGNGINKDSTNCHLSPHSNKHKTAANLAVTATEKYILTIKDRVGLDKMKVLFGISDTLAFAVDTTGSMITEIDDVKQKIAQIVDARVSSGAAPTTRYVLVPFNDPGGPYDPFNQNNLGPITSTDDPQQFKNAVNNLTANAGSDCPELANAGMDRALDYIDGDGNLFVFTDAGAKDNKELAWKVRTRAKRQKVPIYIIYSGLDGSCDDPEYAITARETGGKLFEVFPTQVGDLILLADILAQPNRIHLRSINGFLTGFAQPFTFPIDSFMSHLNLMITGTGATNIVVYRPDGIPVLPADVGVIILPWDTGVIYSITSPPAGTWTVTVSGSAGSGAAPTQGMTKEAALAAYENANDPAFQPQAPSTPTQASSSGEFSIDITGESTVNLQSFKFVEQRGREGHEGFFPIDGSPIAGQTATITADINAPQIASPQFQFRALDETVLQTFTPQTLPWPVDPGEPQPADLARMFEGNVTVPSEPFRVYLTGTDPGGNAVERRLPELFDPVSVKVKAVQLPDMYPGQSLTHTFEVTNLGPADTFRLTASDDKGYARAIQPAQVSLATNETKQASLSIEIPPDAPVDSTDSVLITAESISSAVQRNTAALDPFGVVAAPSLKVNTVTATALGGNGNTVIEPGEGATLTVSLLNTGTSTATNITATLVSSTSGAIVSGADSAYPNIAPGGTASNSPSFVFYLPDTDACGALLDFVLVVNADTGGGIDTSRYSFTVQTGQPSSTSATVSYTGAAVAIPDADPAGVDVPLTVTNFGGTISDLDFRFDGTSCSTAAGATTVGLDHTYDSDLAVSLTSPQGTTVELFSDVGGSGHNFCQTRLDDQSTGLPISLGFAPFTGTFIPGNQLSAFHGENPNGTWKLHVADLVSLDTGHVRAFSLLLSGVQYGCATTPPSDTTAPSCSVTDSRPGPPPEGDITVQDTGIGLAAIRLVRSDNVQVDIPTFTPGTTNAVVVTGRLIEATKNGSFEIESVDVAGNVSSCNRIITGANNSPPILFDDFDDNSLDTLKWTGNDVFSGFSDLSMPLNEISQGLEIGPLLQNTSGSHYRGIRTINSYNFTGGYSQVELVQPASSATGADAMFTIGYSVNEFYRIYVSGGNLIGQKKIAGSKTTLFTLPYDALNHRFLRIRHDATNNKVVFETAPTTGTGPGTWVQRYTESWSSSVQLSATQFEMKAGTSQAETNASGKVIFDNFEFGLTTPPPVAPPTVSSLCPRSGSVAGGTPVTIQGTGFLTGATVSFGGVLATSVEVASSSIIIATTPAHAAGLVDVQVTNANGQSGTLANGYTYVSLPPNVVIQDDFNDNCLDSGKWTANDLFSGFIDLSIPISEVAQRLEIGALLQNTNGSHYRGIRTINAYDFTGAYSYVELVQPASTATHADAMFTVGYSVNNLYRIYVSQGNLIGQKKIGGASTTLFTVPYDSTNHRFLRIRHDATTNSVVMETAPTTGSGPGTWTQRYSEAWNSSVELSAIQFELKGGTWQVETSAPGKVIFDTFLFSR